MRDGLIAYFLVMLLRRLPMILLSLGAIIFAIVRWRANSRASLITIIAFLIYLIDMIVFTIFLYWYPQLTESWRLSPSAREWVDGIIFFMEDFVTAAIIILLTAAAFIGRTQRSAPTSETS
jgi:membrane protease YdiL (CAAX protease family)